MRHTSFRSLTSHRQTGAALVVGLLLLLVLTVLAISGVNSTSLNLIMAGNAQFAQDAFQAAESGIEVSMAANQFNPDPNLPPETQTVSKRYSAVSRTQLCGMPQPALPGSSLKSYSTYHFEIESTGESARGASARNIQALAIIAPADATVAPAEDCPSGGGGANTKFE
ncbi:MAG TPA: pilus assembly PilX N-terminal domain-containing protein [Steroidobacter sp.]|nr:pilus assembly PilX N-terminal domain-containing protein [Steroidobacter sp.]